MPNQFWFGSELMVSPVTEANDPRSLLGRGEIWLPEGIWFDFFTGLRYEGLSGRRMEVYRPLETMPVFAKAGAIVPMAQYAAGDNRLSNAEEMEVLVFPGANNRFTLYEDAGEGSEYSNGSFAQTKMELNWGTEPVFTIHPAVGDRTLIPQVRTWKIGLRGFHKDISVEDGCWDPETNTVWVKVVAGINETVVVHIRGAKLVHDNGDVMTRIERIICLSQHCHQDKELLWEKLQDHAYKKPPTLKTRVSALRSTGLSTAKSITELLTLTEEAF